MIMLGAGGLTTAYAIDDNTTLQNALIINSVKEGPSANFAGFNNSAIPGFVNENRDYKEGDSNKPTEVTVKFSNGAQEAKSAGCILTTADASLADEALQGESQSMKNDEYADNGKPIAFESYLAGLICEDAEPGRYQVDAEISLTANDIEYIANTTLVADNKNDNLLSSKQPKPTYTQIAQVKALSNK